MAAIMLIALLNPWSVPTEEPVVCGKMKHYSEGLMGDVADNRGLNLDSYMGGVALMSRGDLERVVWLEHEGAVTGPFLVVDCAQRDHYAHRVGQDDVAEVSFEQALLWGMEGPEDVCVWFMQPPPVRWH